MVRKVPEARYSPEDDAHGLVALCCVLVGLDDRMEYSGNATASTR